MITTSILYRGEVTITYYDKNMNIKAVSTNHNTATPWFYSVICLILATGTNNITSKDIRPGKFTISDVIDNNESNVILSRLIPKSTVEPLLDSITNEYFVRYTFLVSYYDLLVLAKIDNLTNYKVYLISTNQSALVNNTLEFSDGKLADSQAINNKICAYTTIPELTGDINYSIAEDEYLGVVWDLYFTNVVDDTDNSASVNENS